MPYAPQTLAIHDLAFERNNQLLFDKIHGAVQSGELLQIRGSNGSGKSTLLRILAGYIEPEQGTVSWQHQPLRHQRDVYQQNLHYIGHQNAVKLSLTALENLQLSAALFCKQSSATAIQQALQKMNLQHLQHVQALHFSAGQLRRLSLTRLLLRTLPLWILDEPLTALDKEGQILLIHLIQQHLTNGGIAILATHQPLALAHKTTTIQLGEADA